MPHTLIIRHRKSGHSQPEFTVQRQSDGKQATPCRLTNPQTITVEGRPESNLRHDLRWYLEHFLDYPRAPNTDIAERIQIALQTWGKDCFQQLFTGAARDWYQAAYRDGLPQLTIKIASNEPSILAWPWEALHDPEGSTLAHACRIERQLDELHDPQQLPSTLATDRVNILLVIARPYHDDVGYQALARPMVEQVKQQRWPVHIDVLRPPTFARLREVLHAQAGFYHIVHFDGHGGYGGVGATGPEAFQSPQGQLVFETASGAADPIHANKLSALLTEHAVPIMVLNACQSAAIDEDAEDPFASVAAALLKAGMRSVVAMGYNLYVSAAQQFVPAFYRRLLEKGDIADAVRVGRQEMLAQDARICAVGTFPLQDWLVPVLYQQDPYTLPTPTTADAQPTSPNALPEMAIPSGDYDFIGRERAIQALEAACLRQQQAGILIYGMAGIGKTILAQGFLQWLQDTHGLRGPVVWLSFDDIRSAEYVINRLVETLFEHATTALPMEQKLPKLIKGLREHPLLIVWDNFESAAGIVDIESAHLCADDQAVLQHLLRKLRGGKSKILITSRASESQLTQTECYRLPLSGLQGEECWVYCEAVVQDLGLPINRNQAVYSDLMAELDGHPLAMRAVLLRLAEKPAEELLAELKAQFLGAQGDDSTRRIFAALSLLDQGLPAHFAPVLSLIGLHQRFVDQKHVEAMLKTAEVETAAEVVQRTFTALERGGLLQPRGQGLYGMHPALNHYCTQRHAPGEALNRGFVDVMGRLAGHFTPKELHEQRGPFTLHSANFYRALALAKGLGMQDYYVGALTQGLAVYSFNLRDFLTANSLFASLTTHCEALGNQRKVAAVYHRLGRIAQEHRDYAAAKSWYQKALKIDEKQGNEHDTASTHHQLGMIAQEQRNYAAAESWYQKALKIDKKQGNEHGAADTYLQLGSIWAEQRDHAAAESWYQKALTIFEKQGNEHGAAATHHQLGMTAQAQRDYAAAGSWYQKALTISEKQGDKYSAAITYHQLGRIAQEHRDYTAAESWYQQSLKIKEKQSNEHGVATTYHQLGRIAQAQRDYATAESWYQKALTIFEKQGSEHNAAGTYQQLGRLAEAQHEVMTAGTWFIRAIIGFTTTNDQHYLSIAVGNYLRLLQAVDKPQRAELKSRWQAANLEALLSLGELEKLT